MPRRRLTLWLALVVGVLLARGTNAASHRRVHTLSTRSGSPPRPTSPTTGLLSDVVKHHSANKSASGSAQGSHSAASHTHGGTTTAAGSSGHSAAGGSEAKAKPRGRPKGSTNAPRDPNKTYPPRKPKTSPGPWWKRPGGKLKAPDGTSKNYQYAKDRREKAAAEKKGASSGAASGAGGKHPSGGGGDHHGTGGGSAVAH